MAHLSIIVFVSILLAASFCTNTPELPKTFDTTIPQFNGCTVSLNSTADVQQAIDAAEPGHTICLEAGSERTGNFILPAKENPNNLWITIRTSTPDSQLPRGLRVGPSNSALLARIRTTNTGAVFRTELFAHHYLLVGLDVTSDAFSYGLITLGNEEQQTVEAIPSWIFVERCWIHGPEEGDCRRGIALNSQYSAVQDCYIEKFRAQDDTQAIGGWNGLGPYLIKNNYLSATGENVIFGGAGTTIAEQVPSDIVIQGNHIWKDPTWSYPPYGVKNLIELKSSRRVLIDSNILENMLSGLNNGIAILLSLVDVLPLVTQKTLLSDVTITNNLVKNIYSGFGVGSSVRPWVVERVLLENNLFYDIYADGRSCLLYFCQDVKVNHNTFVPIHNASLVGAIAMAYEPTLNVSFTNNIASLGRYGIIGDNYSSGNPTIGYYAAPAETINERWQANVLFTDSLIDAGSYPPGFYFPTLENVGFVDSTSNFALSAQSPFKNNATDGTDVGVNMALLLSKVEGVLEGTFGGNFETPNNGVPSGIPQSATPNKSPSSTTSTANRIQAWFKCLATIAAAAVFVCFH